MSQDGSLYAAFSSIVDTEARLRVVGGLSRKDARMSRFSPLLAVGLAVLFASSLLAAPASKIETMTAARNLLAQNKPTEAIAALEAQLPTVDGDREFMDLLRNAYQSEIRLLTSQKAEAQRIASVRTKLALIGGTTPDTTMQVPAIPGSETPALAPPAALPVPILPAPFAQSTPAAVVPAANDTVEPEENTGAELLKQAAALFNQAKSKDPNKFIDASRLFGLAFTTKIQMRKDQLCAWAYCRVKLAADKLNKSTDPAAATDAIYEVEAALALAPDHAGLQSFGQEVLVVARQRVGKAGGQPASGQPVDASAWQAIETESFRISFQGSRTKADALAKTAETKRIEIASKWSGPLGGAWKPKCEIVLHASGESFASATRMPAAATGRAEVKLKDGQPISRRIDLRADDDRAAEDALPRELTHIVLADLFWDQPPPKWAEIGMSVMSASDVEVSRHLRTVPRCARNRELLAVSEVLKATEVPTAALTGFYVESVSLVDYLVSLKGEKAFTTFLRDAQRYGTDAALKRQYGLADSRALEESWRKAALAGQ